MTAERFRLKQAELRYADWKRWGTYLPERQWGTVREDYSPDSQAWQYFPHDHARSRAYRWGEDGLLGWCDRQCRLCFAVALWNGNDPILKERLFGLSGPQGSHGEDVKECYYYLDATPTHSYNRALYKYPHRRFPYEQLIETNHGRDKRSGEFELEHTGIFDQNRYFDVTIEYAKAGPNDILIRLSAVNRGPDPALLHLLPTLWFRNSWSWGCIHDGCEIKPTLRHVDDRRIEGQQVVLGKLGWEWDANGPVLMTENETNFSRLFGTSNLSPFVKDAFHDHVIEGQRSVCNPRGMGTKSAIWLNQTLAPGETWSVRLRLYAESERPDAAFGNSFDKILNDRIKEADEFHAESQPSTLTPAEQQVHRQAAAGLLWSKQFYHYAVAPWLDGDPEQPPPPAERKVGRNADWRHLFNRDIISMPDKWEYPWYAAWDTAFHMIPFARLDPEFAKSQLILFLREWYMHPNGQIPAYEWNFSDVNPPVHAWACWRVYKMTGERGNRDTAFLARCFHKLLLNFTWWVNRKDLDGRHLFAGGFLGLDNIGVFDRSSPLPGGRLEQADGTAWMAFYCGTMLSMALELALADRVYEDVASKFFEHFVHICDAINTLGGTGLWDETDGFYYDRLQTEAGVVPLRTRSMVGLVPLIAVEVLEQSTVDRLPGFARRMNWFLQQRPDLAQHVAYMEHDAHCKHRLLAVPNRDKLVRLVRYLTDPNEFLSPFGVRSLSKVHQQHPFVLRCGDEEHVVEYAPAESTGWMFGGNSNWRGPIWFPLNYLIIEALERYHHFYRDALTVEYPHGSGQQVPLSTVAADLSQRLVQLFLPDAQGRRPCHGQQDRYRTEASWQDLVLFYEYFDADTGRGCGASHQTGWTALVKRLIENLNPAR